MDADRIRLIHKRRGGQPGAWVRATLDHQNQWNTADDMGILVAFMDGEGVSNIIQVMVPSGSVGTCGAKRAFDRIFWLEQAILAFEGPELAR